MWLYEGNNVREIAPIMFYSTTSLALYIRFTTGDTESCVCITGSNFETRDLYFFWKEGITRNRKSKGNDIDVVDRHWGDSTICLACWSWNDGCGWHGARPRGRLLSRKVRGFRAGQSRTCWWQSVGRLLRVILGWRHSVCCWARCFQERVLEMLDMHL